MNIAVVGAVGSVGRDGAPVERRPCSRNPGRGTREVVIEDPRGMHGGRISGGYPGRQGENRGAGPCLAHRVGIPQN